MTYLWNSFKNVNNVNIDDDDHDIYSVTKYFHETNAVTWVPFYKMEPDDNRFGRNIYLDMTDL